MTSIGCHNDESKSLTHGIGGEIVRAKLVGALVSYMTLYYSDRYKSERILSLLFLSLLSLVLDSGIIKPTN